MLCIDQKLIDVECEVYPFSDQIVGISAVPSHSLSYYEYLAVVTFLTERFNNNIPPSCLGLQYNLRESIEWYDFESVYFSSCILYEIDTTYKQPSTLNCNRYRAVLYLIIANTCFQQALMDVYMKPWYQYIQVTQRKIRGWLDHCCSRMWCLVMVEMVLHSPSWIKIMQRSQDHRCHLPRVTEI